MNMTLLDILVFFSLSNLVIINGNTLSSINFSGCDFENVTMELKSTGRESIAASNFHFTVSFTPLLDLVDMIIKHKQI